MFSLSGVINVEGVDLSVGEYKFVNHWEGDVSLVISNVSASCGCSVVSFESSSYAGRIDLSGQAAGTMKSVQYSAMMSDGVVYSLFLNLNLV